MTHTLFRSIILSGFCLFLLAYLFWFFVRLFAEIRKDGLGGDE